MTSDAHSQSMLNVAFRRFDAFESALAQQAAAFESQNADVHVCLHAHEFDRLHELAAGDDLTSGALDIFLCPTDWASRLIADNKLLSLEPYLGSTPPPDWPEGWSESLLGLQRDPRGALYGLPYHDGPELLIYRTDLFASDGERQDFALIYGRDLQVPETWDDFRDVAQFFTRPEQDLSGCVLAAKPDGHNNVYDFFIQLYSRGGRFAEGGRATFAAPEGCQGLRYLADLIADGLTQPEPRRHDSVGSGEVYVEGRAAMMWNWCGFAAMAELPGSRVRGQTGLALVPRGSGSAARHVSLSAYWVMAVARGSRKADLAWEFLRFLATPEMDKVTASTGAIGCRRSTWADVELQKQFSPYGMLEDAHRHAESVPNVPQYEEINALLGAAIDDVYVGRRGVRDALEDAAHQVTALLSGEISS